MHLFQGAISLIKLSNSISMYWSAGFHNEFATISELREDPAAIKDTPKSTWWFDIFLQCDSPTTQSDLVGIVIYIYLCLEVKSDRLSIIWI
mmetsp:Transcript_3915/g.5984  ORF Transcript_3915/g.5984 Transcript_3915/m.5984 type:complete len:91 (-) Transcript_3915:531-803(-)